MPFLSEIDSAALKIGAVNTIKILPNGHTIGYNSDYWGFKNTLTSWTALAYFKSKKAFEEIALSAIPLLEKYDSLKKKTNLAVEEQWELDRVIREISRILPTSITQFDDYGKAIDISTANIHIFLIHRTNECVFSFYFSKIFSVFVSLLIVFRYFCKYNYDKL